jgi:hypothetical protein
LITDKYQKAVRIIGKTIKAKKANNFQYVGPSKTGMRWKGMARPVPLPVQALDHATDYLMAAAALRGLAPRLREQTTAAAFATVARGRSEMVEIPGAGFLP